MKEKLTALPTNDTDPLSARPHSNSHTARERKASSAQPLLNLMLLSEEETPALISLSDRSFRLLVDMVLTAQKQGHSLFEAGKQRRMPTLRPRETPYALNELVQAGLIEPLETAGHSVESQTYRIKLWEDMTDAKAL